ncbi:MAG: ABC transporter ATP-binding protein [Candidatus Doudnabacteria bacterium]|nr:ABC transporter ATP-binding protein [Candidatus Doudnabacteria bacterium]
MARFAKPEELDTTYTASELIQDVWRFLAPRHGRFFIATGFLISRELAALFPPFAFAKIITLLSVSDRASNADEIYTLLWWYVASVAWSFIATFCFRIIGNKAIEHLGLDVERRAIEHLFGIRISWHEKENSGNKMKRMNNGLGGIQQVLRIWLNNIVSLIVGTGGIIIVISQFNKSIGLVLLGFITTYYLLSRALAGKAAAAANAVNIQSEKVNGLEFQAVNNIRTVKVLGMREPILERVQSELSEMYSRVVNRIFVFQARLTLLALWTQAVRIGTLIVILRGVIVGQYEVGFLILFNSYFQQVRELASNLSDVGQELIIARFSVGRLKQMLAETTTDSHDEEKRTFPKRWKQLSLKQVHFTYGTEQVLSDISLTIQRGEKIGIVGLSGAGKSTLFKLLLKEYEDFAGSISFDKTAIQDIKSSDYFRHVAVVLQDTEVFNFSVKENITLANDEQKDNEELLQRSLEISHVQDFLHKLPEGMDSMIGEKGVKLSGGEKQRLGIARAVFKQPQILLLDEATSHLDVESEEKIKDSLHHFFHEVTAIVIAHRLTTVKAMDRIYVLEDGKILESGTFDELYQKKGRFYELWEKQKL